ncbi:hypothetical protein N7468_000770 [Penicillium chermesinum]|uniref:Uncharacterized protein n=1 Tax=Penicillium chermesinum TaxID=63820 RepID=A0A9W9TZ63_9EURO|nr:uncharacterized protein N7468_000770 [Penicillium chermesinum]KAJ5249319.1 hypothetical protein N7468_000770 [Penicillium chermesinum]
MPHGHVTNYPLSMSNKAYRMPSFSPKGALWTSRGIFAIGGCTAPSRFPTPVCILARHPSVSEVRDAPCRLFQEAWTENHMGHGRQPGKPIGGRGRMGTRVTALEGRQTFLQERLRSAIHADGDQIRGLEGIPSQRRQRTKGAQHLRVETVISEHRDPEEGAPGWQRTAGTAKPKRRVRGVGWKGGMVERRTGRVI